MATLLAHIRIQPGRESAFEDITRDMVAKAFEHETGVIRYEYWRGREPGFYYCLLSFPDNLSFWRHQASDHHEGQMERFAECIAELDLEVVDPVHRAAPLPSTRAEYCPTDESLSVREQAQLYPIAVLEWWERLRGQIASH